MTRETVIDIAERSIHTFWQGAVGSLPATIPTTRNAWEAAGWSIIVGGLSAVLALFRGMVRARGTHRAA
jgi:hypothetical protein